MADPLWHAPTALIPLRARVTVPAVPRQDGVEVDAPTLADAAVFLAAAAVTTGTIVVRNWDALAGDRAAPLLRDVLASMGAYVVRSREGLTCTSRSTSGHLSGVRCALGGAPELLPSLVALAALADDASHLSGLDGQDRQVEGLRANLQALGGLTEWDGSALGVHPQPLHAGRWLAHGSIDTALAGGVLALVVPGVDVEGVDVGSPDLAGFFDRWRLAMTADEHILPGTSSGAVPYYH